MRAGLRPGDDVFASGYLRAPARNNSRTERTDWDIWGPKTGLVFRCSAGWRFVGAEETHRGSGRPVGFDLIVRRLRSGVVGAASLVGTERV